MFATECTTNVTQPRQPNEVICELDHTFLLRSLHTTHRDQTTIHCTPHHVLGTIDHTVQYLDRIFSVRKESITVKMSPARYVR